MTWRAAASIVLACACACACACVSPALAQSGTAAMPPPLAAWLAEHTDIAPQTVLYATADRIVALREVRSRSSPSNLAAELRVEFFADGAAGAYGERSSVSEVFINCPSRRLRTQITSLFRDSNRQGQFDEMGGDSAWSRGQPGSDTAAVIAAACGPAAAQTETTQPAQAVKPVAASPDLGNDVSPPQKTWLERPGEASVQLGASSNAAEAAATAVKAKASLADLLGGLSVVVQAGEVRGVLYNRTVVRGFASRAAAGRFCEAVKLRNKPCLVRYAGEKPRTIGRAKPLPVIRGRNLEDKPLKP